MIHESGRVVMMPSGYNFKFKDLVSPGSDIVTTNPDGSTFTFRDAFPSCTYTY